MQSALDLNKIPDEFLINYYQDLLFSLAKSSKELQKVFLKAYYNLQEAKQNRIINKVNFYAVLGFSAMRLISGTNNTADTLPYLLSLTIAAFNFIAEKCNTAKLKFNIATIENFITQFIDDEFVQAAVMLDHNSHFKRILECIDKAFLNILLSEKHMIRIQNYKYMSKLKSTTNCQILNKNAVNDGLVLLSRSILKIDKSNTELALKELALKGDVSSIIFYYLSNPQYSTKEVDDFVMNIPSEQTVNYPVFFAKYLSGMFPQDMLYILKTKLEQNWGRSMFTEKNGKYTDFGAFCECIYLEACNDAYIDKNDVAHYKQAEKYLNSCKTDLAFFYTSYIKAIYKKGKNKHNGKCAIQNFAARGLSSEIINAENITVNNIYAEKEYI